ncbi:hypothetical protein Tcan_09422 [Toxocara canis]|uniref:Uncharacterized protein n=1 Tax=Toxocara canis TaxID=6265 RepID=A0A0B2W5W3_TOXCA|nr:hypothetical protein Tcan_09422 [Toxocara canis]
MSSASEVSDFDAWDEQEIRQLRFRFYDDVELAQKHSLAQQFFKDLVSSFLKDYVTFLKRILKLMQGGYLPLHEVEIDMQFAKDEEAIQMPDIKEYGVFRVVAIQEPLKLELGNLEIRQLRFRFYDDVELAQKHSLAQQFFKDLVSSFLKGQSIRLCSHYF